MLRSMSMSTPFQPEPVAANDERAALPDDDRIDDPEVADDDEDARRAALGAREPQGYVAPRPGDRLTTDELRRDLG